MSRDDSARYMYMHCRYAKSGLYSHKGFIRIERKKGAFHPICTLANICQAANNEQSRKITLKWTILSTDLEGD